MNNDNVLKLALALYSNPGIYALLLGSGVSRAAGILTGWEIVLDLIFKLATLEKEEPGDLEKWYTQRFGEPPDYSKVLDRLTTTPTERMALLRSYFEPTPEERDQGIKLPTPANRAIAKLVQYGYIRIILTTNFDRLLETALADEGIVPDLISTDDGLHGAVPYVHSPCVIYKLHGDYRDTRIKNTPEELANYSQGFDTLLDRVFDEFGLIICGWSGAWDRALRDAILRCPTHRFTTFWLTRGEPQEEAARLIHHRRAEVINIDGAENFFPELSGKIESLRELERPHPLSVKVAVSTVKRYLSEPKYRIPLHDLIYDEVDRACKELSSERFTIHGTLSEESFQQRMREYEAVCWQLMAMLVALSYHDEGKYAYLLQHSIERLAQVPRRDGITFFIGLQLYPALLISYASGISALAAKRFINLAAILLKSSYENHPESQKSPAISVLNVAEVFSDKGTLVPRPDAKREYTPGSNYLYELLRPFLRDYLPDDNKFGEAFDVFEYLGSLTFQYIVPTHWCPVGRFGWKYGKLRRPWEGSPPDEFIQTGLTQGENWPLLKAGFFNGSVERMKQVIEDYKTWLQGATRGWGW